VRGISYGIDSASDYQIQILRADLDGIEFELFHCGEKFVIQSSLPLRHNGYNLAAALSVLSEEGFDLRELIPFVKDFPGVSGRMERVDEGQEFHVFVDYAHTPDALFHVLAAAEPFAKHRIISVFGCGGDRDRMKRPLMGKIASQFSDVVILTSDNSRSEDTLEILSQIKFGIDFRGGRVQALELADRAEAIQRAVELAVEGDLVFIFGKGHEEYQIFGATKVPFSDQETARSALRRRCSTFKKLPKFAAEH
jgi:UDP-N-acetylmuramoyl-L-alanyl-D-glutamate--2,6-diaminopimelate ligase